MLKCNILWCHALVVGVAAKLTASYVTGGPLAALGSKEHYPNLFSLGLWSFRMVKGYKDDPLTYI